MKREFLVAMVCLMACGCGPLPSEVEEGLLNMSVEDICPCIPKMSVKFLDIIELNMVVFGPSNNWEVSGWVYCGQDTARGQFFSLSLGETWYPENIPESQGFLMFLAGSGSVASVLRILGWNFKTAEVCSLDMGDKFMLNGREYIVKGRDDQGYVVSCGGVSKIVKAGAVIRDVNEEGWLSPRTRKLYIVTGIAKKELPIPYVEW